eukprot:GHVR01109459.1.p1 GENE.GHVR01109459.1~~GHVR01109459.1.p1  ORF type:complete len:189 (+),score=32.53 GHVR01109459.1:430-996(+)
MCSNFYKYIKIDGDFKAHAYSDKECTKSLGVSQLAVYTNYCNNIPGPSLQAKGLAALPEMKAASDYLCSYLDGECKILSICNKTADGCILSSSNTYFKRNAYTNQVELHYTDKCDSYVQQSSTAVDDTTCTFVGGSAQGGTGRFAKFSTVLLTTTSTTSTTTTTSGSRSNWIVSYFTFAVIALLLSDI